jgi:hypothetical protein
VLDQPAAHRPRACRDDHIIDGEAVPVLDRLDFVERQPREGEAPMCRNPPVEGRARRHEVDISHNAPSPTRRSAEAARRPTVLTPETAPSVGTSSRLGSARGTEPSNRSGWRGTPRSPRASRPSWPGGAAGGCPGALGMARPSGLRSSSAPVISAPDNRRSPRDGSWS